MSFQHEALLYEGREGFLAGTLPYIKDALDAGEPLLLVTSQDKLRILRDRFGEAIEYADMAELGRNPARIIPAWQAFIDRHDGPVRGIGEPIWRGRGGAELVECQLHEALLNVAFDAPRDFRLLCPYDRSLAPARVARGALHAPARQRCARARSTAPSTRWRRSTRRSRRRPRRARILAFERDLGDVRRLGGGLRRSADLVLAVNELAANSIRHGGGRGVLRVWRDGEHARLRGPATAASILDPLAGRRAPGTRAVRRPRAVDRQSGLRPGAGPLRDAGNHRAAHGDVVDSVKVSVVA